MVSTPRRCSAISTSLPSSPLPNSMTLVAWGVLGVPKVVMAGSKREGNGKGGKCNSGQLRHNGSMSLQPSPAPATDPLLRASNLSKRYGDTEVVSDLSFEIAPGECLGVIGPNG